MKTDTHLGIYTDKGGRPFNEDAYLAVPLPDRPSGLVFLGGVADGVGGRVAGRAASSYAVKVLQEFFLRRSTQLTTKNLPELLRQIFYRINANIYKKGTSSEKYAGMGTTLTCLLASPTNVTIAHVGDTRAYIKRGSRIFQITRDHLMEDVAAAEEIDERFALFEEEPVMIGRVLGVEPDVEVDIYRLDIEEGDTFVLVSDGIYGYVEEKTIFEIIDSRGSSDEAAGELAGVAVENGATDNVTMVIWEAEGLEETAAEPVPAAGRKAPAEETVSPGAAAARVKTGGHLAVPYNSLFEGAASVSTGMDELERLMDVALEHELLETQREMEDLPETVEEKVEEPDEHVEEPAVEEELASIVESPPLPTKAGPLQYQMGLEALLEPVEPVELVEPVESVEPVEPVEPVETTSAGEKTEAPVASPTPPPAQTFAHKLPTPIHRELEDEEIDVRAGGGSGRKMMAVAAGVVALLLVSGALLFFLVIKGGSGDGGTSRSGMAIPPLAGMTLTDARSTLETSGLKCGEVKEEACADVEKGKVITTVPAAGEACGEDGTVSILLSLGPSVSTRTAVLPNVMGLPQEEALNVLLNAGFNVTSLTEATDEEVAAGCVSIQDPAPDSFYPEGTQVVLVVSTGPSGPQLVTCSTCGGTGKTTCPTCGGRGTVSSTKACSACGGSGVTSTGFTCSTCGGSGRVSFSGTCSRCGGAGKVTCGTCGGRGQIPQ